MSDRILVMYEGRVRAIFDKGEADESAILKAATGVDSGGQGHGALAGRAS